MPKTESILYKLYHAVEHLDAPLFITDKNFFIEYVNPAFSRLSGFCVEEISGALIFGFFEMDAEEIESLKNILASGHEFVKEIMVKRKVGQSFWMELNLSGSKAGYKTEDGYIAVLIDRSLDRLKEVLVKTAEEELANTNHARTAFFSSMTHELKNPISAIITSCDLLLDRPDEVERMALQIKEQAQRLYELITAILDYVKSEGGIEQRKLSNFPLRVFIRKSCIEFSEKLDAKGLALECEMIEDVAIYGDQGRLGKVFTILMENAIKFTDEGKITIRASVENSPEPILFLSVRDTGIGIAPEEMDDIFKPFALQSKHHGHVLRGAGIGLALANNIVKLMGGEIFLESSPGEGSMFTIKLPVSI